MLDNRTLARLLAKVDVRDPRDCWLWTASLYPNGYGQFVIGGKHHLAHRVMYSLTGSIPDSLVLDHLCRNRACVNPAHLEPVTHIENMRRGLYGVLKTHCPHGHPYDDENTGINNLGRRFCKACNRERCKAYQRRRRAEARQSTASLSEV